MLLCLKLLISIMTVPEAYLIVVRVSALNSYYLNLGHTLPISNAEAMRP